MIAVPRERIAYQAGLLGLVTLVVVSLLLLADRLTAPAIALRQAEDLRGSLTQIIPAELYDNDLLENRLELELDGLPVTVYQGRQGDRVTALAWQLAGPGYAGDINLVMGMDRDGRILGVRVVSHSETPGLGDKIEVAKDPWILGFQGRSLGDPPPGQWAVKKDDGSFDQFTGATITPRATVAIVKRGLRFFANHRQRLLDPGTLTTPQENAP